MCISTGNPAPAGSAAASPDISDIALLPDFVHTNEICASAYELPASHVHISILNHQVRTFLHAYRLAQNENSAFASPTRSHLLFTACILHDMGASPSHDGPQRFEIEGADVAVRHLTSHGVSEADAHEVWVAIALHSTPGIAERISELARIVRTAVLIDFGKNEPGSEEVKVQFERQWPRGEIERILSDEVVRQAVNRPDKAPPAGWPGILYRSHLEDPHWTGVNRAF